MKVFLTRRRTTVAVFVAAASLALGGTATAAALITGAQIQDESVYSRDIANANLTGADVTDASITPTDYDGPVIGPTGPVGPTGPAGSAGVRNVQYRTSGSGSLDPSTLTGLRVTCPSGSKALSGGVASDVGGAGVRVLESAPLDGGVGWQVFLRNEGTARSTSYAWVVCATA